MTRDDLDVVAEAIAELALEAGMKASAKAIEGFGVLLAYLVRLEARVAEIETRGVQYRGVLSAGTAIRARRSRHL